MLGIVNADYNCHHRPLDTTELTRDPQPLVALQSTGSDPETDARYTASPYLVVEKI